MTAGKKKVIMTLVTTVGLPAAWLGVAYLLQEHWRTITVGRDTTFVTGPLRADGTVDFVGAINARCSEGVTPENNAVVKLLPAIGTKDFLATNARAMWFELLGVPDVPDAPDHYVTFREFMKARAGKPKNVSEEDDWNQAWDAREDVREHAPWREGDDADMAAWIKRNEAALGIAGEASRCERFYSPLVGGGPNNDVLLEAQLPALGKYRTLNNGLTARTMMRLGAGDVAGYREDLLTTGRLGHLVMQGPTLIERLVGLAMVEQAYRSVEPALGGRLKATEARELLDTLRGLKPMPEMVEAVDQFERLIPLDIIAHVARYGPDCMGHTLDDPTLATRRVGLGLRVIPVRFDDVMRECNGLWDQHVMAARKPTYVERNAAFREAEQARAAVASRKEWDNLRKGLDSLEMVFEAPSKPFARQDEVRMRERLAELGLLLEIYRGAHGEYPETLEALPKDEVRGADEDFFSAGKMVYRREGSQAYVVYSVGRNARDDGGKEPPRATAATRGIFSREVGPKADLPDDLVLRVSVK